MAERCIVYRGVPPFPTGYNNNYQIFQTPEYVVIFQEHIHDVRIIPLGGRPPYQRKRALVAGGLARPLGG